MVQFLTLGLFAMAVLMTYPQGTLDYPASLHINLLSPSEEFEVPDAGHYCKEQIQRKVNGKKLNIMKGAITTLLSSFQPSFWEVRSIPLLKKERDSYMKPGSHLNFNDQNRENLG